VQLQAFMQAGDITNDQGRYSVIFNAAEGVTLGYIMALIPMAGYESRGFPVGMNVGLGNSTMADILVDVKMVTGLVHLVDDAGHRIEVSGATTFDEDGHLVTISDLDWMNTSIYL